MQPCSPRTGSTQPLGRECELVELGVTGVVIASSLSISGCSWLGGLPERLQRRAPIGAWNGEALLQVGETEAGVLAQTTSRVIGPHLGSCGIAEEEAFEVGPKGLSSWLDEFDSCSADQSRPLRALDFALALRPNVQG